MLKFRNSTTSILPGLCVLAYLPFLFSGCGSSSSGGTVTAPPTLTIASPSAGTLIPGLSTLTGTCDEGAQIQVTGDIKGGTYQTVCTNGLFAAPFVLVGAQGSRSVSVTSTNPNGASATQSTYLQMPKASLKGANLFLPCGNYYGQYYYPADQPKINYDLDYYKSKGLTLVRMPMPWETLQPVLNGPLTGWQVACIHYVLNQANLRSMKVILDLHNYGRYIINNSGGSDQSQPQFLLGSASLPYSAFKDVWTKLATEFNADPALYGYDIMNEPHDMGSSTIWPLAAQAATDGIRTIDHSTSIIVSGDEWSIPTNWNAANANLAVTDPDNNVIYQAHLYFDQYSAGQYATSYDANGAYPNIGVDRAKPFVDWINLHGYRGIFGEFGAPGDDPRWLTVNDNFLNYISANGMAATVWAGGYLWEDFGQPNNWYLTDPAGSTNMPANPVDRPLMAILKKYPSNI